MASNRKAVQISATGVQNNAGTQCNWVCVALCDDETMWVSYEGSIWQSMSPIPQEKEGEKS